MRLVDLIKFRTFTRIEGVRAWDSLQCVAGPPNLTHRLALDHSLWTRPGVRLRQIPLTVTQSLKATLEGDSRGRLCGPRDKIRLKSREKSKGKGAAERNQSLIGALSPCGFRLAYLLPGSYKI